MVNYVSIYDWQTTDTDHNLSSSGMNKRGEKVTDTSSVLYDKHINKVSAYLKKDSGATGNVYCKVEQADGTIIASDSVSTSTLSTSYSWIDFFFANNTTTMANGDRVYIEYTDSTSNVTLGFDNGSTYGGAAGSDTIKATWHSAEGYWNDVDTGDYNFQIWEDTDASSSGGSGGSAGQMYTSSGSTPHNENRPLRIFKTQRSWF